MDSDRLCEVARNLFKSTKAGDDRTLGEKAIGLLAFQQLGARMDIVSRAVGSEETWCLSLERGSASATLEVEKRRARTESGTTVYLRELDKQVLRMLTQRKVVDYLRNRRGAALEEGAYELEVVEGQSSVMVTPEAPDGVLVPLKPCTTLWGPIEFTLYVAPPDAATREVAVVGRAGTSILDDLTELEEFAAPPWNTDQVSGRIMFGALQQSAGRRAVLRDDDAFPLFVDAVASVTSAVSSLVSRLATEVDRDTSERLSEEIRGVFATVLRELDDLDNPMRTSLGAAGMAPLTGNDDLLPNSGRKKNKKSQDEQPSPTLDDLTPDPTPPRNHKTGAGGPGPGSRTSRLPSLEADRFPGVARSRFDAEDGVVLYNDRHPD
jgi:hypothetical protein